VYQRRPVVNKALRALMRRNRVIASTIASEPLRSGNLYYSWAVPESEPAPPLLAMRGIRKTFPGVVALDGVSFDLRPGEVHVLLGENGAGKSTLMKILSGAYRRDSGEIEVDGRTAAIGSPRDAQALGIATIYQELSLVPHLSVAENILLGHEPSRGGWIDRARLRADAMRSLAEAGLAIDPDRTVGELGVAEQQMVELAKALFRRARVLVMDEPTSALTAREIDQLFDVIRRVTAGGVGVVYISHRMRELTTIGHRVTVLRDGRNVGTFDLAQVGIDDLVRLMANREVRDHFPRRRCAVGHELLRLEHVSGANGVDNVSVTVCRGEIVGVAGLLGAGRTELARLIAGADRPSAGRIVVNGIEATPRSPRHAIRAGIGFLPEDRKRQGLVMTLSVGENIGLANLPRWSRFGLLSVGSERRAAQRWVAELRIKTPNIAERVVKLSGGTQQKVVLARWLAAEAQLLVMDEPTRGVDVGAKVEIYELMNKLTEAGAGILMISSELPEVLGMSDRIYVMRRGRIEAEFTADQASEERVLQAALGLAS
jgi:ribose transport system ATP-binding protein